MRGIIRSMAKQEPSGASSRSQPIVYVPKPAVAGGSTYVGKGAPVPTQTKTASVGSERR